MVWSHFSDPRRSNTFSNIHIVSHVCTHIILFQISTVTCTFMEKTVHAHIYMLYVGFPCTLSVHAGRTGNLHAGR